MLAQAVATNLIEECSFLLKQNLVYQADLQNKLVVDVARIRDLYLSKLVPMGPESVLVIGGQTEPTKGGRMNVVKRSVTELQWNRALQ